MKTVYELFVPGIPKAQPRPRMTKTGHVYTPDSAKEWKETIQAEFLMRKKEIIDQPVKLTVCFFFLTPKSKKSERDMFPHTVKPDADNLLKAVMDAMSAQEHRQLTAASVWTDDALVYSSCAEKWYTPVKTGARIRVEVMSK